MQCADAEYMYVPQRQPSNRDNVDLPTSAGSDRWFFIVSVEVVTIIRQSYDSSQTG